MSKGRKVDSWEKGKVLLKASHPDRDNWVLNAVDPEILQAGRAAMNARRAMNAARREARRAAELQRAGKENAADKTATTSTPPKAVPDVAPAANRRTSSIPSTRPNSLLSDQQSDTTTTKRAFSTSFTPRPDAP
ncbi:hypothetical protein F53441_11933 [Fusarium austroafricanum]|uniref:Uncharacterized protein n=1 Tax=Fusarium austroafricanum TaxID=2364996 RepID=A0A8H4K1B9_9HYPO|nr:hypothetical protein F53441_11933 [Fusarium austroafricanum]